MMRRRTLLVTAGSFVALAPSIKAKADTPGVTATEIKIGNTAPYSGPASAYGAAGRGLSAYFRRLNEQGGIAGRRINFISLDDSYSPPKTVEQTRRLVEEDEVAFTLLQVGTAPNMAVKHYLNQRKVPQLFLASGVDKWGDYKATPWSIGWWPSYRSEGRIYGKYILAERPVAKIAILFQNDDLGKDYILGLKDSLGDKYAQMVVKEVSYEVTDPTIDSQVVSLRSSGADVLVSVATPKFAAQLIRKIYDLGWKPLHLITNVSISVAAVLVPAGRERSVGLITACFLKDNTDPRWRDDSGMDEWRGFMAKYLPGTDTADSYYLYDYAIGQTVEQTLRQCGGDFSRENIMRQATNLHDLHLAPLLPGITVNTSPTNFHPVRHMQLARFNGSTWELFGGLVDGGSST